MLGVAVSFGVYYLTRKNINGKSILDDILDNPSDFVHKAKDYAIAEAVQTVKENV